MINLFVLGIYVFQTCLLAPRTIYTRDIARGRQALKLSHVSKVPKASMYGLTYRALCKELGAMGQDRGHVKGNVASAAPRPRA